MADEEAGPYFPPVTVKGGDYQYEGWRVTTFTKRSGEVRCVVEDSNGRLFIHNLSQVTENSQCS